MIALVGGIWFSDCGLLSVGSYLMLHAFYLEMDAGAPWDGWRVAIRCWVVGLIFMLFGLVIGFGIVFKQLDMWHVQVDSSVGITLTLMAVAGLAVFATLVSLKVLRLGGLAIVFTLALLTQHLTEISAGGFSYVCMYATLVAIMIARAGWVLARYVARDAILGSRN